MNWILAFLIALAIGMALATLGVIIHRSLPLWREDRREFFNDLSSVFVASFFVAIAVAFMSFMGMLVAATHEQATISLYIFLGSGVYALGVGVSCT